MMFKTSELVGPNDLHLDRWRIIELREGESIDRHIFGWCAETGLWQLSSKILSETPEYIQTRSRKYFKVSEENMEIPLDGVLQLIDFLNVWQIEESAIKNIVDNINKENKCLNL